ncbi:MAG: T9SS type A sorting domain-containing protein [Bacteroidota bacterium]|nr:T9SS type A sorting domain-containing protein [Bacteroidota bacterium]
MYNYFKDDRYKRIYEWYRDITQPNGEQPAYDDTWIGSHKDMLALTRDYKLMMNPSLVKDIKLGVSMDLKADYLATRTIPTIYSEMKEKDICYPESGNAILRTSPGAELKDQHYIHLLGERRESLNGGVPHSLFGFAWGHEHGDAGSFILTAGEDVLMMDPSYYGENNRDWINNPENHNSILIDNGPHPEDDCAYMSINPVTKTIYAKYNYWKRLFGIKTSIKAIVERTIEVHQPYQGSYPYYVMTDVIENFTTSDIAVTLNLNGNGHGMNGTFALLSNNEAKWDYPCEKDNYKDDNWKIFATTTAQQIIPDGSSPVSVSFSSTLGHNNGNERNEYVSYLSPINNSLKVNGDIKNGIIGEIVTSNGKSGGKHSQASISVNVASYTKFSFQTTLEPYPCLQTHRSAFIRQTPQYTSHLITPDSLNLNFHFSRANKSILADTVINPFEIDTNAILETDARNVFFSYSTNPTVVRKGCTSTLNFRKLRMADGRIVTYHDTTYIESSKVATAFYSFISKMKYDAYVEIDTACAVKFFIPDGITGYQMTIKNDSINSSYNDATKILTATFPKPGFYRFVMELVDPCLMSCFFPLTADSIKNTFQFYEGTYEYLAHDLDIVADTGQLLLSHGSRMHICQNYTLINNDSIVLKPYIGFNAGLGLPMHTAMSGGEGIAPNHLNYPGNAFTNLPNLKRTSIIVDDKAALVLDSGSYTHIGVNCLLWIKKGGTLLVKKGAVLEVGSCGVGYDNIRCGGANSGAVFIDDSAFICVEDSAMLRFFKLIGDTVDRNIFFISTHPDKPALAGVNNTGASGKFSASDWNGYPGRFFNHNCIALCSLYIVNPPDVVHNEPWGWCNYNIPKSSFIVRSTYCVNDTVFLEQTDKSLNETRTIIQIFQHDTLNPIRTGSAEAFRLENYFKINFFNFDSPDVYYIRVITINSCGNSDTLTRSVSIIGNPTPSFTLNSANICPGKNNLFSLFNSAPFTNYFWHVHAIDTSFNQTQAEFLNKEFLQYGADWVMDSITSDTFYFDDFYFYGGHKYAVSLTTKTICETKTIWDTIDVEPGAYISLSRPKAYAAPINGATSVQLNGYISVADSFRWEPEIWLNRTDTNVVVSTPLDSIHYILIAKYGECTSTDTAFIKYNHIANAGVNDTICFTNDTAILGNSYDMSIFLGYLYYKGGIEFYNLYSPYTSTNPAYFRYLTHFLMHNEIMDQWLQCGTPIMDKFKYQVYRRQILKQPWFKTYYSQLTQFTDIDMVALDLFVDEINNNNELAANLDAQGSWAEIEYCATQLFSYYDNFLSGHLAEISSSWVSISNGDTAILSSWDEYFVAAVNPSASTSYIQTVITPQLAEIDEVIVYRDTILFPYFFAAMQFDSTVYFANATSPFSDATTFSWNFGDGSPLDFSEFPIHTFPAFDSSYIVCMTALNKCGSFEYCDTVRIDSSSLNSQRVDYTNRLGVGSLENNGVKTEKSVKSLINRPEVFLTNYPNPFSDQTIIDYQIWQSYSNATLVITNTLGQVVFEQKLIKPINKVSIDGNLFGTGLYYYSIIVDQSTKLTKMMSVMH